MRTRNEETYQRKKEQIMEACYACYAKNGLHGTGIRSLAEASGISLSSLYTYFNDLDDLTVQSTAYCMAKVEDEFMAKAPTNPADIERFVDEIPYWTAKRHGAKYRLMYQVYTHPRYAEHGHEFFSGVDARYTEYAERLAPALGIPSEIITPLIFIFVRACVHYALFEDEFYLQSQMRVLKTTVALFIDKYRNS